MKLYNDILLGHNDYRYKFFLNTISRIIDENMYCDMYTNIMGIDYCIGDYDIPDRVLNDMFYLMLEYYNIEINSIYYKGQKEISVVNFKIDSIENIIFMETLNTIVDKIEKLPKKYIKDNIILIALKERIRTFDILNIQEKIKTNTDTKIDFVISNIIKSIYTHCLYLNRFSSKFILEGIFEFINQILCIIPLEDLKDITNNTLRDVLTLEYFETLSDDNTISDLKFYGKFLILKDIINSNKYDHKLLEISKYIYR